MVTEKKGKVPSDGSGIEVRKTICSICTHVQGHLGKARHSGLLPGISLIA
jgi:hypothetical protein